MPKSSKPARPAASSELLSLAAAGLGPVRPERFAERVYETLFHAIVEGRIAVGSKLPSENDLATLFEVSRPVVRQALDRLRADPTGRGLDFISADGRFFEALSAEAVAPVIIPRVLYVHQ